MVGMQTEDVMQHTVTGSHLIEVVHSLKRAKGTGQEW